MRTITSDEVHMDTTKALNGKVLVERLAAAMLMHGRMFSRSKLTEFRLLLRKSRQPLVEALQSFIGVTDFPGSIEIRPGKEMRTAKLFELLANMISVYVSSGFQYFAQQLKRANNDLSRLKRLQPEQLKKIEDVVEVLHVLMALDRDYMSNRGKPLIGRGHKEDIQRYGKSISHRVPDLAESLGLDESDLAVWANQTP